MEDRVADLRARWTPEATAAVPVNGDVPHFPAGYAEQRKMGYVPIYWRVVLGGMPVDCGPMGILTLPGSAGGLLLLPLPANRQ